MERSADSKADIEALERLIEPEDEEVCLRYILKYSTSDSNIFQLSDTEEKKDHLVASKKALVRAPRREGSRARKLAKRVARHQVSRNSDKSPSVPREDFANAVAAAKLVVIQERRISVGLC